MFTKNSKAFVGPNEGIHLPSLDVVHKVPPGGTGGALLIEEWGLPPGAMIPPHTHDREHECSHVLEGELTCFIGGEVVVAPKGSYVLKPRGVPHAFYNAGERQVRVMEILTPGGNFGGNFAGYFDEYERLVSSGMDENAHLEARAELGARYGITWHDKQTPEVRALFGIAP